MSKALVACHLLVALVLGYAGMFWVSVVVLLLLVVLTVVFEHWYLRVARMRADIDEYSASWDSLNEQYGRCFAAMDVNGMREALDQRKLLRASFDLYLRSRE